MKCNKFGIPLIILLLIIFVPAAGYSLYQSNKLEKEAGNIKHLSKFDGKLFFYDSSDTLIGFYKCESTDCKEATTIVDDKESAYDVEFSGHQLGPMQTSAGNYVFIEDGGIIKLVNLKGTNEGTITSQFKAIKDYDGKMENIIFIENEDGKWGAIDKSTMATLITPKYEAISASYDFNQTQYIGLFENEYYIVDNSGSELTSGNIMPIKDFDENTIIYYDKNSEEFIPKTYDGSSLIPGISVKKYLRNNMMFVIDTGSKFLIYTKDLGVKLEEYINDGYKISLTNDEVFITDGINVNITYHYMQPE